MPTPTLRHLGLVSLVADVPLEELTIVAAALQKQMIRDFTPAWAIDATVDVFTSLEALPAGTWPILVVDESPGSGTHYDHDGQPVGLVEKGPSWSLSASHEAIEMVVDPWGNKIVAGDSPADATRRAEILVELCDPCQDSRFGYTVNGVLVSDFVTPAYYDPSGVAAAPRSFTGAVTMPRSVLPGGYVTFRDVATGRWRQLAVDGAGTTSEKDLGPTLVGGSLRAAADAAGTKRLLSNCERSRSPALDVPDGIKHRSAAWRKIIESVRRSPPDS